MVSFHSTRARWPDEPRSEEEREGRGVELTDIQLALEKVA
jgi:hypothetical protein